MYVFPGLDSVGKAVYIHPYHDYLEGQLKESPFD